MIPSLVAEIVAFPAATAVARPELETVLIPVLLELQPIARPARTLPFASFVVAVSCCVPPTGKLVEAGLTVTVATGTGATVICVVAVFVSLVAVMVTAPAPTADTRPVEDTVAAAVLLELHVTARPVSTLPAASWVTAESCCVPPTTMLAVAGVTVTVATGTGVTVIAPVPVLVSEVAVIVTGPPVATALTRPLTFTVATAWLLDDQVIVRPMSKVPLTSLSVAVNCCVPPTMRLADVGLTATVFTGARVTVIEDVPNLVSLVAVIVVPPDPTAVTRPLPSTVAAAVLLEDQSTARPASSLPAASRSVAVSCCVGVTPSTRLTDGGVTVTVATGGSATVIEDVPVFVSLVAVIVTGPPAASPVTRPFPSTVAAAAFSEAHVTTRSVSTLLAASRNTAVSCCFPPTIKAADGGLTVTVLTGASVTVIAGVGVELTDSLVAVIVAVPTPTAVTVVVPLVELDGLTVTTAGLLETQFTVRSLSTLPVASLVTAESCCVSPTTTLVVTGLTATVATGTSGTCVIVIELVPDLVSEVAVIVTGPPAATALTRPFGSTVATAALLDDQVTVRSVSTLPVTSLVTAVTCCVPPTTTLAEAGATVTVATGTGLTAISGVGVELTDSLVAVIVAVPTPTAVTVVVPMLEVTGLTVSTAVLLETQFTERPLSALLAASRSVAVSCCAPPTTIGVVGVEIVTVLIGASITVIEDVPVFVSLVAVIVTGPPTATAVTRPAEDTLATAASLVLHVAARPLSKLPVASFVTAVSCCVPPTTILTIAGLTVTVATGTSVTVIALVPALVSEVAVIVTGPPAATPLTRPLASTVARAASLVLHVTVRPVITLPAASLVTAESCCVPPATTLAEAGPTVTVATGIGVTVICDEPVFVSLVAVMVMGPPAPTAFTSPLPSTVATAPSLVLHVTVRPVSPLPVASLVTTESCWVPPITTLADAGLTATVATGTRVTLSEMLELFPPEEALIVAEPSFRAVSSPLAVIVAIVLSELFHVTAFERIRPSEVRTTAVNCADSPTTSAKPPFTIGLSAGPLIVIVATPFEPIAKAPSCGTFT
jgi:hypothetical protein